MYNKYLPLGSIVVLKDSNKKLMITGFGMISNNIVYDYASCVYPCGYSVLDETNLFNHDDIEDVLFLGYRTLEQEKYNEKIINYSMENYNSVNVIPEKDFNIRESKEDFNIRNDVIKESVSESESKSIQNNVDTQLSPNIEAIDGNQQINPMPNPEITTPMENNNNGESQNIKNLDNQSYTNNVSSEQNSNATILNSETEKTGLVSHLFGGMMSNNAQNIKPIDQNIPLSKEEADEMFGQ